MSMKGARLNLKHRYAQAALVTLLAFLSAACGASRPYKYYILDVPTPPPSAQAPAYPITLLVGRVSAPLLYRDTRLVYGSGEVQLGTYEYNRWAEMPAEMLQDALVSALRGTGQYRSVSKIASDIRGDYILRSHLFSLYGVDRPSMVARFSMEVDLFDPKSASVVWTNRYSHDEPIQGKTVADVVEAMDRNVQAGMSQFTSGLAQYFAAHPPEPPTTPGNK
jgi:ABC-type uncharacterized transport system auxiliary subunit